MANLNELHAAEEAFLKQKFKIKWLQVRDQNTGYFHKVINGRLSRNTIKSLTATDGSILSDSDDIKAEILWHYEKLLGSAIPSSSDTLQSLQALMTTIMHEEYYSDLIVEVTIEEIHLVIKSMPNNKSPGPDGFTSEFFKETWEITGGLVASAFQDFFNEECI